MILALSIRLAARVQDVLSTYAPSNVRIRHLRSPGGRRWMLSVSSVLAAGYLAATAGLTSHVDSGASGWLNLVTLVCAWNAIRFAWLAFASVAGVMTRSAQRLLRLARTRSAVRVSP